MPELQLVKRKQVWQLEIYDPASEARYLVHRTYPGFPEAETGYQQLAKTMSQRVRGKSIRQYILSDARHPYSLPPSVIHASTEIPY